MVHFWGPKIREDFHTSAERSHQNIFSLELAFKLGEDVSIYRREYFIFFPPLLGES